MTPEQFCYWLQGYAELSPIEPTIPQWKTIQDHLKTVFDKRTPTYTHPLDRQIPTSIYPEFPKVPICQPPTKKYSMEDTCTLHQAPDCMECFYTTSAERPSKIL